MLLSFSLKSFKSYRESDLPLAPLTVLIGANASGKSNAIEGLRLMSWLAQGQRLSAIQYSVNSGEQVVRGTARNLPNEGANKFGFACSISGTNWRKWDIDIELRDDGLHIISESITSPWESVPLYILDQPSTGRGTDVGVAYNNFARGGKKPHITCIDQMPIFSQLATPASISVNHKKSRKEVPTVSRIFEGLLSNILFLDPNPQLMRNYSFPAGEKLRGDGANLSAVLFDLCGQPKDEVEINDFSDLLDGVEAAPELLSLIQSLPEQNIDGIRFIREPRGGVMVSLTESFGGHLKRYDASLLSDGTLRVLSIAAALLSAPVGTMVVIEEIDNGVHPSRAKHLLTSIRRIAEARQLRVLMSTHNPALLDALPDESIPDVLFCYRSIDDGSSKIMRLSDSESYPEIVAQDSLGGLLTSGLLDRYAKLKRTRKDRANSALKWLKRVRQNDE
ncbi:Predicted ATPase [Salipiger thiooxidans]|uniref:Predicted ATPase n=1 Tax=Salipiger thiooxidans TaxID=282683 RepID=A0A1G7K020_9RHOB|nr:ATP-binding protein [Salipiger thiooxidans]SDF30149.1 Predicted ATPase [Salipiger thiooxidans]